MNNPLAIKVASMGKMFSDYADILRNEPLSEILNAVWKIEEKTRTNPELADATALLGDAAAHGEGALGDAAKAVMMYYEQMFYYADAIEDDINKGIMGKNAPSARGRMLEIFDSVAKYLGELAGAVEGDTEPKTVTLGVRHEDAPRKRPWDGHDFSKKPELPGEPIEESKQLREWEDPYDDEVSDLEQYERDMLRQELEDQRQEDEDPCTCPDCRDNERMDESKQPLKETTYFSGETLYKAPFIASPELVAELHEITEQLKPEPYFDLQEGTLNSLRQWAMEDVAIDTSTPDIAGSMPVEDGIVTDHPKQYLQSAAEKGFLALFYMDEESNIDLYELYFPIEVEAGTALKLGDHLKWSLTPKGRRGGTDYYWLQCIV